MSHDLLHRPLGHSGIQVPVVGIGCNAFGTRIDAPQVQAVVDAALERGVTFFDTADVYGDGRSEKFIGRFLRDHDGLTVATKMGRRVDQVPQNYRLDHFREWTDRSRRNLGVEVLDLVQLHCPPTATITDDATWDALDALVDAGAIAAYGVSVETCDQALAAIARPGCASVQIILNAFRLKPLDAVLPAAREAGVGIIARVPLASGLLSGRYTRDTTFASDDHRTYNRHGEAFDVGETFSGVDFEVGVQAAQEFAALLPEVVFSIGPDELAALAARALQPRPEPVLSLAHLHAPTVSVREQAHLVVDRLRRERTTTFRALTADADLMTTVARFLALLELFREGVVGFDQASPLGDLHLRWTGGDDDVDIDVGDEFDGHTADDGITPALTIPEDDDA